MEEQVQPAGGRSSRILVVTRDQSVLAERSETQEFYRQLHEFFDEVHVMVLVPRKGKANTIRLGHNVWLYQVNAAYWWLLPWEAKRVAVDLLVFSGSPRPDIIIGTDQFEAGLGAYLISRAFTRPLQLHLRTNHFDSRFARKEKHSWWRKRLASYVLKRTGSVRTYTSAFKEKLTKKYSSIIDVEVLPRFYNFTGLRDVEPTSDVHKRYADFSFVMVTFSRLTADCALHDVFSALVHMLRNPAIGLLVIGNGPGKELFVEKSKLLGCERNVVFLDSPEELASILKTADVLLEPSGDEMYEKRVLQALVAGLPIIAAETELRLDLLEDGKSAFLYKAGDIHELTTKANKLLNSSGVRARFRTEGKTIGEQRLYEDSKAYYNTYRDTVESVLTPTSTDD